MTIARNVADNTSDTIFCRINQYPAMFQLSPLAHVCVRHSQPEAQSPEHKANLITGHQRSSNCIQPSGNVQFVKIDDTAERSAHPIRVPDAVHQNKM